MAGNNNAARRGERESTRKPQPIRGALFDHVSRALLDPGNRPTESESEALINALSLLLPGMTTARRRELAEEVNALERPPPRLIGVLARDDIEVARLLLRGNQHVSQNDLRTITQTGTEGHRLVIAGRHDLTAPVTDALIEYGDERVIDALVQNPRAAFSLKSLARLAVDYRHIGSVEAFLDETLGPRARERAETELPGHGWPEPEPPPRAESGARKPAAEPVAPPSRPGTAGTPGAPPLEPPPLRASTPPAWLGVAKTAPAPAPAAPLPDRPPPAVPPDQAGPGVGAPPAAHWRKRVPPEKVERIYIREVATPPETEKAGLEAAVAGAERSGDFSRSAADWTWETDRYGYFTQLSERAIEAFGLPSGALIGRMFTDFGEFGDESSRSRDAPQALEQRIPFRQAPFRTRNQGSTPTSWLINGVPMFEVATGAFQGYRGTANEASAGDRKLERAQDDQDRIAAQMAELESRGEQLNREFESVQRSRDDRAERMASLSHEFRTPLNAIIGFSEVIAAETEKTAEAKYAAPAKAIRDAAWGLNSFVSDLLDMARIEAGTLEVDREPVSIHEALGEAISKAQDEAAKRGIEIRLSPVSTDLRAEGDHGRILQVLDRLFQYALAHATRGSEVPVEVRAAGISAVRIDIGCDAPGPASGEPGDLFARVVPPPGGRPDTPRVAPGFALSLARDLVRLMAGELSVWLGQPGVRFRIQLPTAG